MNLGWTEILLIAVVGLLLFGPSRLPQLGKSIGQAIRGFKKGLSDELDSHGMKDEEERNVAELTHEEKQKMNSSSETNSNASKAPSHSNKA